jgi:hypothetical protein
MTLTAPSAFRRLALPAVLAGEDRGSYDARPCAILKARAMPMKTIEPDISITVMSDGNEGLGI